MNLLGTIHSWLGWMLMQILLAYAMLLAFTLGGILCYALCCWVAPKRPFAAKTQLKGDQSHA